MLTQIDRFIATPEETLRAALQKININAHRLLLLVDADGRLIRTITDGDIRRLLLAGATMDDRLSRLPASRPIQVASGTQSADALKLMVEFSIDHVPVVDAAGRPVGLFERHDLDTDILLSTPHLSDYERDYVEQAFSSNWVAPLGPNVDAFEKELAGHVGIEHAAALSSGTAAIHLALCLLGVGRDDVVFCSSLTFVASANPILYQGARPVFIDSEPETWNMSPRALEHALHDAKASGVLPKAVIVVNLYGQSADMDAINTLCDRYGVPVVEDAAESLGASYKGKASGTLGRIGIYSFNGNKIITTSGGGMLVAHDGDLVKRARFLSTQARDPAGHYEHTQVGYNYRMSNILAGVGRGQLRVLKQRVEARRMVYQRYAEGLSDVSAVRWMPEAGFGQSTHWLTALTLDAAQTRLSPTKLIESLSKERIEARRVWKPMHRQPLYADAAYYPHDTGTSISDDIFAQGVCLPSGSNMSEGQQARVIEVLRRILQS